MSESAPEGVYMSRRIFANSLQEHLQFLELGKIGICFCQELMIEIVVPCVLHTQLVQRYARDFDSIFIPFLQQVRVVSVKSCG